MGRSGKDHAVGIFDFPKNHIPVVLEWTVFGTTINARIAPIAILQFHIF
jgi:hypothetical protein